jgi:hypothetical protein
MISAESGGHAADHYESETFTNWSLATKGWDGVRDGQLALAKADHADTRHGGSDEVYKCAIKMEAPGIMPAVVDDAVMERKDE